MSNIDFLIASLNESKYFYVIQPEIDPKWFLFDIGEGTPERVMWTSNLRTALIFPTEQVVEEFRSSFLSNRNTYITRMERKSFK